MTSLLMAACLFVGPQHQQQIKDPGELGRMRSQFGDPPLSAGPKWNEDIVMVYTMSFGSTHILFPVGAADRRYYIHPSRGALVFETKTGSKIKVHWIVRLLPLADEEKESVPRGTLYAYLASGGRRVPADVTPEIRASLEAVKPFAFYRFQMPASSLECGYITPDGEFYHSDERGDFSSYSFIKGLPKTDFPYPISKQEKKALGVIDPPLRMLPSEVPTKGSRKPGSSTTPPPRPAVTFIHPPSLPTPTG